MAENEVEGVALGVSWDGTGYGPDGTVWGGEFLRTTPDSFSRAAHFRTFRLPGGDAAVKEPRRAALGVLYELLGDGLLDLDELKPVDAFSPDERRTVLEMLKRGVNSPLTSSAGRLFDAAAALAGIRQVNAFEGQAAMMLEFALQDIDTSERYPIDLVHGPDGDDTTPAAETPPLALDRVVGEPQVGPVGGPGGNDRAPAAGNPPLAVDWGPMMRCVLDDVRRDEPVGLISARFHNALVEAVLVVARAVGEPQVVLSGGCFQNVYLTERTVNALRNEGFRPYWHQRVPTNDGGISLGQAVAAMRTLTVRTREGK